MSLRESVVLGAWLACACACAGECNPPVRIGGDLGIIDSAAFIIDPSGNPVASMTANGKLYYVRGQDGFATVIEVGAQDPAWKTAPALAMDSSGITYLAWWAQVGPETYEAAWASNPGGLFKVPARIPGSATAQPFPMTVALVKTGVFIGWSAGEGNVVASFGGAAAEPIALGGQAAFDIDRNGAVHAVYARGGDLFYRNNAGGDFQGGELQVTRTQYVESSPAIAVAADGFPFVLYRSEENGTRFLRLTGGAFAAHRTVAMGVPAWNASAFGIMPGGAGCLIVYAAGNAVYCDTGGTELAAGTIRWLWSLTGGEEALDADADAFSYLHAIVLQAGALLYRNDAPPPGAAFEALPREGELPLSVQFESRAEGHVLQHRWEFGDGAYASAANPAHAYAATGRYTVTLTVIGTAGASDTMVWADCIAVVPKRFHLQIPDLVVYDDQLLVPVPVKATSDIPVQGFTLAGRIDPTAMTLLSGGAFLDLSSTVTQFLQAEFVAPSQDPAAGTFIVGVIFDIFSPITGKAMPPCRNVNIANIVVQIKGAPAHRQTFALALENGLWDPPTSNAFTIQGSTTVYPELHPGSITVIRRAEEDLGRTFLRGDVNDDGKLGLNDAIALLTYLFGKGTAPICPDAADLDDGGKIDIADPIALLSAQFSMSMSPAPPYPMPGLDPTADALPSCQ